MTLAASASPFAVLRRKNFSLMWIGQLISTMGSALTSLAASIQVYRQTDGSALSVGLMLMVTAAPTLLVGLVAGVFVDRYDRRRIMIISNLLQAVLVFLIPFLISNSIIWLYILVFLSSAIAQFFDPAYESILPETAPDEELAAANSLIAISSFGSTAVGFAASGLIAARFPIAYAFYLDAFSFLFSAVCIFLLQVRQTETVEETSVALVMDNLKTGVTYLLNKPVLRSILILGCFYTISAGLGNSLLLPFSTRALHATTFEYGLQEGLTSVGFVIASLLMATYANRWREGQWVVVSLIGMGIVGAIYAGLQSVPLAIALQILSGFLNAPYSIARRLLIQRNTDAEIRGRVMSAFYVASDLFFLVGMAAAGLADVIDVRLLYLFGAVITIGGGIWALALPGLGQPAAEWRRALKLLRTSPLLPGIGETQPVQLADINLLIGLIPSLKALSPAAHDKIFAQGRILDVTPGTKLTASGEAGNSAYFILDGKAVAGTADGKGSYHSLSSMTPGDYFGEIAALTGAKRTADVVAEEPTRLLQVPAATLHMMMAEPAFSRLVLERMSERLVRTSIRELPRTVGIPPHEARELREEPSAA